MNKKARCIAALALAAAPLLTSAQAAAEPGLVWVDNDSFGFEACAALAELRGAENAPATLAALRESAQGQVQDAVRLAGVAVGGLQHLTLTPVEGRFACGAAESQVTFRLAAVDALSGKFWSADLTVRAQDSASDAAEVAALASDLAASFRGVVVHAAAAR